MKTYAALYAPPIKKMTDENKALIYLGYRGSDIPEDVRGLIDFCEKKVDETAEEKYVYKKFRLTRDDDGISFAGTGLYVVSRNLSDVLKDCEEAYLLAVTLGIGADTLIRKYMVSEPEKGVLLDSLFSVKADKLADKAQQEIEGLCKRSLSFRFSPGYGDLPLECQNDIIDILDTRKRIGLFVTSSQMMTPTKSVTAILGVKNI